MARQARLMKRGMSNPQRCTDSLMIFHSPSARENRKIFVTVLVKRFER